MTAAPNISSISSISSISPISIASADRSEALARTKTHGLLAPLWLAAPDAELLHQFTVAVTHGPEEGGLLEPPWHALLNTVCDTVQVHPRAPTWCALAASTREFIAADAQAFDRLEQ